MKKILYLVLLLFAILPCLAADYNDDGQTQEYYKKRLKENFYTAACTPVGFAGERKGLVTAIDQERVDIVNWIMLAGYNPNDCTFGKITTAYLAIKKRNEQILDILLKNGVDPNSQGITHTPLTMSIYYKCPECVEVLINNGADVNDNYRNITPLDYALKETI